MVKTTMGKVITVSAFNVLIRKSVVPLGAGGSSGSVTINTGISLDYGVGLLSLTSGS